MKKIIKGFASDVFNKEPIQNNSYFKKNDNCILGSHNSSNVIEKVDKVSILAIMKLSSLRKKLIKKIFFKRSILKIFYFKLSTNLIYLLKFLLLHNLRVFLFLISLTL